MKQPTPPKKKSSGTKRVTSNIPSMMPPIKKAYLDVRVTRSITGAVDKAVRKLTPLPDKKRSVKTEPTRSEMTAIYNRQMTPTNKGKKK